MEYQYCCYYLVFLAGLLCYCVIASDWPEGYYGLPMANTGCPGGATFDWKRGWIYQDTENDNPWNDKSNSFHLEGHVESSSVNRSFCVKTQIANDQRRPLWPTGIYCIYQKTDNCPLGFKSGSITWDDEDTGNKNNKSGTLPKVDLNSDYDYFETTIYFCCRNDGYKTVPIDLPTGSPFYLFAHMNLSCQQVKWAVATSEWIEYQTEEVYDSVHKPAPYVMVLSGQIKMHYCYYISCQYTLHASTGMIEFPSHSGNYASGLLCSWKITVQASQTIEVHFILFQLRNIYDQLIFYDGKDDSAPRLATLHGKTPSNITSGVLQSSSSNLFMVFRTNRVNTATCFQASYIAISTPVTVPLSTSSTTAKARSTTTATETQVVTEKTNPTEITLSSSNPPSKSSSEPSSLPKGNSSKNYDAFKKTCIQKSQSTLTAVAIVIPLICLIAVIAMAVYLFFRLRNLRDKPSDVSVRYTTSTTTTESVTNPAYIPSDAVIEARPPSTNNACEDSKGDIYQEIEPSRQATDNPLYQSTDEEKHVYASFA